MLSSALWSRSLLSIQKFWIPTLVHFLIWFETDFIVASKANVDEVHIVNAQILDTRSVTLVQLLICLKRILLLRSSPRLTRSMWSMHKILDPSGVALVHLLIGLKKNSLLGSGPMWTRPILPMHRVWHQFSHIGPFVDLFVDDFIDAFKANVDTVHTINAQILVTR